MNYYLVSINIGKKSEKLLIQASSSYKAVQFVLEHKGNGIESIKEVYKKAEVLSKREPLYVYGFEYEGCSKEYVIANDLGTVSAYYPKAIAIWKEQPYKITIIDEG